MKLVKPVNRIFSFDPIPLFYQVEEEDTKEEEPQQFSVALVRDLSFPDNSILQPEQKFTKVWLVKNTGKPWDDQVSLRWISGDFRSDDSCPVPPVGYKKEAKLSVELAAPKTPGKYVGYWSLFRGSEEFGARIWCQIVVPTPHQTESAVKEQLGEVKQEKLLGEIYVQKIKELNEMGFSDFTLNMEALQNCDGDVVRAIEYLMKK